MYAMHVCIHRCVRFGLMDLLGFEHVARCQRLEIELLRDPSARSSFGSMIWQGLWHSVRTADKYFGGYGVCVCVCERERER